MEGLRGTALGARRRSSGGGRWKTEHEIARYDFVAIGFGRRHHEDALVVFDRSRGLRRPLNMHCFVLVSNFFTHKISEAGREAVVVRYLRPQRSR
jgi:hypothetical protein